MSGSCWWEHASRRPDAELVAHAIAQEQHPTRLFLTEDGEEEWSAIGWLSFGVAHIEWYRYTNPLRELIKKGASLDAICIKSAGNAKPQTPLDIAFEEGDVEFFCFLIENGATPNREPYDVDMFDEVVDCYKKKQKCLIAIAWSLLHIRQDDDLLQPVLERLQRVTLRKYWTKIWWTDPDYVFIKKT